MKKTLLFLGNNETTIGKSNAKYYRNISQYQQRHDKVRSLQGSNLIMPALDPDTFLDIVDDLVIDDLLFQETKENNQQD